MKILKSYKWGSASRCEVKCKYFLKDTCSKVTIAKYFGGTLVPLDRKGVKNQFDVGKKYLEYLKSACHKVCVAVKISVWLAHNTLKFRNHTQIMMLQDFTIGMFLRHQIIKVTSKGVLIIISLGSS